MGGKAQRLLHPEKSRPLWRPASSTGVVPNGVGSYLAQRFSSALTLDRILCIIWPLIKRFDRFTRPRRQGSQVRLSFSQENSRGCFI